MALGTDYVISLAEARYWLNIPPANVRDDDKLQNIFIPSVNDVIRHECGQIMPKQFDENYDGGDFELSVRNIPVLEVQLVEEGWGWTNYTLDYVQVNSAESTSMFAYSLDNPRFGTISRRSGGNVNIPFMPGNDNIRIVYVAGRQFVPGAVKHAALELLAFWYRAGQQPGGTGPAGPVQTVELAQPTSGALGGLIGMNVGVPVRVIELLRPYRHMPFIG